MGLLREDVEILIDITDFKTSDYYCELCFLWVKGDLYTSFTTRCFF
jgi:hypothetical protein